MIWKNHYTEYQVSVPSGKSGGWEVSQFTVAEKQARLELLRSFQNDGRGVPAGTYTRLTLDGDMVMSDTPDEIRDHLWFIHRAKGRVLINGLGLGVVVKALLRKPEVESILVVERSEDVIKLVAGVYAPDQRFQVVNEDAFTFKPPKGTRFDFAWHDIWPTVSGDNVPQMHKLHRKYGRIVGEQGSWCRYLAEQRLVRDRQWDRHYSQRIGA
jgi:hypothetical protein